MVISGVCQHRRSGGVDPVALDPVARVRMFAGDSPLSHRRRVTKDSNFYVGWGTLALINANLAQLKGGGGLFWFCLSLLLGPIATCLLAFRPTTRASLPAE